MYEVRGKKKKVFGPVGSTDILDTGPHGLAVTTIRNKKSPLPKTYPRRNAELGNERKS